MSNTQNALCTSPILDHIQGLHREFAGLNGGAVATYIPELANADPNWFGICIVTASGGVYEAGDSRQSFTIQSISKPFVYGLALEDRGRADVLKKIGVDPTGDAFNAISLDPSTGRPRNPMINAGAIAATGMIEGKTPEVRLKRLMAIFELYAGEAVYLSESRTGHRNRAIRLPHSPTPIPGLTVSGAAGAKAISLQLSPAATRIVEESSPTLQRARPPMHKLCARMPLRSQAADARLCTLKRGTTFSSRPSGLAVGRVGE